MNNRPTTEPLTRFALFLFLSQGLSAAVTTLIYEDFEGEKDSAYLLNGSSADTGQTWTASNSLIAGVPSNSLNPGLPNNSTDLLIKPDPTGDQPSDAVAYIGGLTLVPNCVYTLSMDIFVTLGAGTNSSDWIGIGFRTSSFANLTSGTVGSLLHRVDPEVQTFSAGGANQQTIPVAAWNQDFKNLSVILSTGSSLANSTVSWEIDGQAIGTPQTTNASAIDGVFFQTREDAVGILDNLTLTHGSIPEPSSALLLGFGTLALLGRRKRN